MPKPSLGGAHVKGAVVNVGSSFSLLWYDASASEGCVRKRGHVQGTVEKTRLDPIAKKGGDLCYVH